MIDKFSISYHEDVKATFEFFPKKFVFKALKGTVIGGWYILSLSLISIGLAVPSSGG
jgi:hypothetical protein